MSQPATTSASGMAARADAWLYGMALPSTDPDAGPGRSAVIQLRPIRAIRWPLPGIERPDAPSDSGTERHPPCTSGGPPGEGTTLTGGGVQI